MTKDYSEQYKVFEDFWGKEAQMRMAIEEMSELTKEICKYIRFTKDRQEDNSVGRIKEIEKDLKSEIADVANCIEQLKLMFGNDEIEQIRLEKIERTMQKLSKIKAGL